MELFDEEVIHGGPKADRHHLDDPLRRLKAVDNSIRGDGVASESFELSVERLTREGVCFEETEARSEPLLHHGSQVSHGIL
ncbi:MAG: hypothetical protein A3K11_14840 [Nitrospirae bacterium RIFCSPLOWO2_12_FULL_63_8]|nr:MAG: hypothetical protein A3K11_14840 [Nitrospirae bacterium RIFCSPLOWO2_12_FULL_63_8]